MVHFTDRNGGVSKGAYESCNLALHVEDDPKDVKENRRLTCKELGIQTDQLITMDQVHGANVRLVRGKCADAVPQCDALITDRKDLALVVMCADCSPVLIYDPVREAIAALHVGRAGLLKNIVKATVTKMQEEFGTNPRDLHVSIGPNIKHCCYELRGKALEEVKEPFSWYVMGKSFDMDGVLEQQFNILNVTNVEHSKVCTSCDEDYFSYRRDGITGRQAGIVMMRS